MLRLLIGLGIVVAVLTVYTLVDAALIERERARGLPRWVWLFVILLIPVIGPLLWLFVGRGRRDGNPRAATRSMAPDDDIDFLKGLDREKDQFERIRALEEELSKMDDPTTDPTRPGSTGTIDPDSTGSNPAGPNQTDPGEGDQPGRRDA
jgi:hypothetical protein